MCVQSFYSMKRRFIRKIKSFNDRGNRLSKRNLQTSPFPGGHSRNYIWRAYVRLKKDKLNSLYNFTRVLRGYSVRLWNLKPVGEERYWNFLSVKSYFHGWTHCWRIMRNSFRLCQSLSASSHGESDTPFFVPFPFDSRLSSLELYKLDANSPKGDTCRESWLYTSLEKKASTILKRPLYISRGGKVSWPLIHREIDVAWVESKPSPG